MVTGSAGERGEMDTLLFFGVICVHLCSSVAILSSVIMARCPSCEYPLPENRVYAWGAHVRIAVTHSMSRPAVLRGQHPRARRLCAAHPKNESIGPCGRCGNYLCEVCRTRWRDQVLCAAMRRTQPRLQRGDAGEQSQGGISAGGDGTTAGHRALGDVLPRHHSLLRGRHVGGANSS